LIYSLLVLSSPVSGHASRTAAEFARCALARGHSIRKVFFLDAGTAVSASHRVLPQDETDPALAWEALHAQHGIALEVCISSALKYGVLDESEAVRYERSSVTIRPSFTVVGLGQLVDASAHSDRLVTFGG
jgi:tRNA 2-thiouridine synthesizing protein D